MGRARARTAVLDEQIAGHVAEAASMVYGATRDSSPCFQHRQHLSSEKP